MNKKNKFYIGVFLVLIAATCNSVSQLIWKLGTNSAAYEMLWYIVGLVISGLGAVFLMVSFRFGDVSILQPMMSIGFVLSMVFGYFFLGESITLPKIIGVIAIVLGSVLLGREGEAS